MTDYGVSREGTGCVSAFQGKGAGCGDYRLD